MMKTRQNRPSVGCRPVRFPRLLTAVWLSLALFVVPLEAQQEYRGSPKALALDVVFLKDKHTLYGIVHQIEKDTLGLVVERQWLRDHVTEIYDQQLAVERRQTRQAQSEMQKRIQRWLSNVEEKVDLRIFLEDELKRIREATEIGEDIENGKPIASRFMLLSIPRDQIRKLVQQPNWQTQVALVSWEEKLADVTSRTASDLRRELEQRQVAWKTLQPNFKDDVPTRPQSDREWAFRQAIVEHVFTPPLEFQGVEGAFVRRGGVPDLKTMLKMALGSAQGGQTLQQLGEELGLPEFTRNKSEAPGEQSLKQRWQDQISIAEREGARGFSAIQLKQSPSTNRVEVTLFFLAQDEVGDWHLLNEFVGSARSDQQTKADLAALKTDPQVQRIVAVSKGLGLTSQRQLDFALKQGLATQAAMQQAMNELAIELNAFADSLSGPPITGMPR